MGFRVTLISTLLLILLDMLATSLRCTWTDEDDVVTYTLLAVHAVLVLLEGVCVFAFFSATIWFVAGLLGELFYSIKLTLPLFIIRLFFVQMPIVYFKHIRSSDGLPWEDGTFGLLFCLDLLVGIAFWVCLVYTACCMTTMRMYAPYHKAALQQMEGNMMAAAV